ncbi:MAG TPA: serine/threonine-protein kinase [Kofleriaceae bacterium]|nr:serine/threonine-protein kinase [Kofleriaceae bacterium]
MQTSVDKGQTGPLGRVDPSLPQVFGRYLLVQRLSRGGMGEIFLAKHGLAGFEKLAVIKKVLPHLAADAQFISRFVDEAQVAIKLQHVNVAQVFEVGRVGDEYFLALEYVEGRDLRRTLALLQQRAQRLPVDLALFIGRELANGLAYAHRRTTSDGSSLNLVHCDISPPNVLVSFEGETKVIDFGIAKSAMRGTATDPKMGFGKFGYMAPEQLIRGGIVDHRTDIYAAGVVLFELLTNKRLYEAGPEPDYRALAKKVAKGEHTMPSDVAKELAPYDDLVATALRPKAEDRYQSAAELRDAIQQALVHVNPTISTDQLGSYMRDLFSIEMTAQRELHERVAKAHLEDFQDELTKETGTTVSFAMANMPLQAPPDSPRPPRLPARVTGQQRPRPPTLPTDILPQQPPQPPPIPTAAIPTQELSLADGTGAVPPEDLSLPSEKQRKSKAPLVILLVAAIAAVAVAGFVILGKSEKKPDRVAQQTPKKIVVEAISPEDQTPKPEEKPPEKKVEQKVEQADKVETPTPPPLPKGEKTERKKHHSSTEKKVVAPPPAVKSEVTKEVVTAKFRQAKAAYDAYKQKNGGRFDAEWNDLAGYQQYHPNDLEGFVQRIESFRAKLRE